MSNLFTAPDFAKKQVVFVMFNEGEKMAFSNDNIVIKDANQKIKFQCTCYRLFIVFAIGHTTLTSAVIQKAQKFGFFIALMSPGFRLYSIIGAAKDGNTLLHRKQYAYNKLDIAKRIIINKMKNQASELSSNRDKNEDIKNAIRLIREYYCQKVNEVESLNELMAYEGLASKIYFRNHFTNVYWNGRQPQIKRDYINSVLDIGYTILFNYIDALLSAYGFDTYCGVMHKQFYMRKSLVCDIVEPFRVIIDHEIKKAINLKQIKSSDFTLINNQYRLKWSETARYIKILTSPIVDNKEEIFHYIQTFYRAFMKDIHPDNYPTFDWE